ncbi:single-stranded DNA-binding protein [Lachnoanaerobaculum gingivalis]|uniref:Single-stranded DNA-binding protein n=1 Tax=Lachnoanaerobaculum gingivalis TaxID=2490855 RepID=A0A3P3R1S1_9FIRM|nr:single-stranded DNA-binding protein [Lachnoanaerobaculum gingivalis]RRJ26819.1 single-stranded DNA-binding protein [Lachnoanaerobaculum gingivalis]
MNLKKGDIIKTALGEHTTVLDVKKNQAVLFTGEQFVIASGIKENKENGKFEWVNGRYANDLKSISNMQNNSFESMKETLSFLAEYNHSDFIKGIISLETDINNEDILDNAYENYMNDSYMGLIDERFMDFIDEDLKTAKDIKQEEIEKDADIQEKSKEEISENEQYQTQENTSLKDNNDQGKQYIKGNLTADVEIKDLRSNEGQDFRVASFSIAQNDGMGNVKFMNCFAYNEQVQAVKDFKKGDFVSLSGKEKLSIGKNGKQYTNFKVYSAKLLKARGQSQDTKEKPSALKKLNDYKEKTDDRLKEQVNMKSEKGVER